MPKGGFSNDGSSSDEVKVYVSSPEYTFLQAASALSAPRGEAPLSDITDLIVLGTELCAMYVHDSSEKFGHTRRTPVATSESIHEYLESARGAYGAGTAGRAAKYILDNSNSPMETLLAIFLSSPLSAGGAGLSKPLLNARVKLKKSKILPESILCDFYWKEARTIGEYDSDKFHLDPKRHALDSERQNALIAAGFKVVRITNEIVNSVPKLEEMILTLRRYLGLRNKFRFDQYRARRIDLWEKLRKTKVYGMFVREE